MSIIAPALADCRARWWALAKTGAALRVVGAVVVAPLYAAVLRLAVASSGAPVLTDTDLAFFATSPIGLAALLVVAILVVAVAAIEVAVLLAVLSQPERSTDLPAAAGLVADRAADVFRVGARFVLRCVLWLAPAIAVAAATYFSLLTRFDINYYLSERPPAFWKAAAVACGLGLYLAYAAGRLVADWFLALPIALFEEVDAARVHRASRDRAEGHRWWVRGLVLGWAAASLLLSSAATGLTATLALGIAPFWPRSLTAVAAGVGLGLLAMVLVGAATNLVCTAAFAALMRRVYLRLGGRPVKPAANEEARRPFGLRITRPRILAAAAGLALASATIGCWAIVSVTVEDRVIVIGHRGAPLAAPENSLSSVRAAIDAGADWVEIDVQETADGEVVVFHDSDFMKAAGVDLKLWEATSDELRDIDIGSRFSSDFADERVPTLAQVLDICRGKAGVLIELKYYGHDERLEQRVVDLVEQAEMTEQTMFMSLKGEGIAKLGALRPEWKRGQLLSVAIGDKRRIDADFLAVNASFASRRFLRSSHGDGREVYAWTVNDPVEMAALIGRGVDGLITDEPATARAVLEERRQMTPLARLLIDLADRFRIALGEATPTANAP